MLSSLTTKESVTNQLQSITLPTDLLIQSPTTTNTTNTLSTFTNITQLNPQKQQIANLSMSNPNHSFDSFGNNTRLTNTNNSRQLSYEFNEEQDTCLQLFDKWSPVEQIEFAENLLRRMCHFQHGHINNFLKPMLQRDFISSLPGKPYHFKLKVILIFNIFKN